MTRILGSRDSAQEIGSFEDQSMMIISDINGFPIHDCNETRSIALRFIQAETIVNFLADIVVFETLVLIVTGLIFAAFLD